MDKESISIKPGEKVELGLEFSEEDDASVYYCSPKLVYMVNGTEKAMYLDYYSMGLSIDKADLKQLIKQY